MAENAQLRAAMGRAVRFARERRRLLQRELAAQAGLARSHLSRIETGEVDPSLTVLARIAQALGMTLDELARQAHDEMTRGGD